MIRLHHAPQTRSMRTLWLLYELDVPFDLVTHPFDKSLRDPDYLALSPAGRVPALEIDGGAMIETAAIAEYLCETHPDADLGIAPGAPHRADWLVWLHFAETISQHAAALTQQHVMLYDDAMRSPVVMKLEAARLGKCYAALQARLAARTHLVAERFTAADIGVAQAVYMARHFARTDPFPAVESWYYRVTNRPAFRKSLPAPAERLFPQEYFPVWEGAR
ncbi:glutathione S-transferase family protein [Roseivivax sp. CAU 1753]